MFLSDVSSLATQNSQFRFLNNQSCLARQTPINLDPSKLHYYQFVVSLEMCG